MSVVTINPLNDLAKIRTNVTDHYKLCRREMIKADLNEKRHNFGILVQNIEKCPNIGGIIRGCNAFLGAEVILLDNKGFDKRSAVGTYLYENLKHVRTEEEVDKAISGYDEVYCFDNVPGSKPFEECSFPKDRKVLLCFGSESNGLTYDVYSRADKIYWIRQYGCVRSLNIAAAANIVMYEWCKQFYGNR